MLPPVNAALAVVLAVLALGLGPILASLLARRPRLYAALDGFVLLLIGGLCLAHLLPHAFEVLGGAAVPLAAAGFVLPLVAERLLHRHRAGESPGVLALALVGLLIHAALDGAALAVPAVEEHAGHAHDGSSLDVSLAVLIHRVPEGLLVWWSVGPAFGRRAAYLMLALIACSTFGGFVLSQPVAALAGGRFAGVVQAVLAGALLHVVIDHPPAPVRGHGRLPAWSALGAGVGLALLAFLPLEEIPHGARVLAATSRLLLESAPAILLGFLGAGLLSLVRPETLIRLMTGRNAVTSALRGVVLGLPLPICSCGVVPIYRSLAHKGVPAAAAVAFLVATPELGIDSVLISIPLLGFELSLVRLVAALLVALAAGVVAGLLTRGEPLVAPTAEPACGEAAEGSALGRAARYGLVTSVDDLGPWILAGLVVAGIMEPALSRELVAAVPRGAEVPLLALVAAPFYVCASAATPIAAVLITKGVTVGAALAFLLTGPATNVTTYGALRAAHGRRVTLLLLATIVGASILMGWGIDAAGITGPPGGALADEHSPGLLAQAAAVLFAALLLASFVRQGPRGFLARLGLAHEHEDHEDHEHEHEHEQDGAPPTATGPGCGGTGCC